MPDLDGATPTSAVRHQLPTAAGVQEPASAHIIERPWPHFISRRTKPISIPFTPFKIQHLPPDPADGENNSPQIQARSIHWMPKSPADSPDLQHFVAISKHR
ncbi:hypothetical protein ACLOJK_006511 [Asimina triloba]